MPTTASVTIQASKERVWEILLDKIFHPDQYIPGVIEFEWKERNEHEYVRTIYTETDDVVELIALDEPNLTVRSTLVRHVCMKGTLVQRVVEDSDGTTLIFEQDKVITIDEIKDLDMQPALDAAIIQIKEKAEATD